MLGEVVGMAEVTAKVRCRENATRTARGGQLVAEGVVGLCESGSKISGEYDVPNKAYRADSFSPVSSLPKYSLIGALRQSRLR